MKGFKTKFVDPYKNGKTNIPFIRYDKEQSGVYFIRSKSSGKIVYIGYSEKSLYKTIYRHFQKWNDISRTEKIRHTYNSAYYQVRVIFTTPARAALLEKFLIIKMQPVDNDFKYKQYLTPSQEKQAEELTKGISEYAGSEKDFPF